MTKEELAKLKAAAEVLDDNGREILAEQLWYVHDSEMMSKHGGRARA